MSASPEDRQRFACLERNRVESARCRRLGTWREYFESATLGLSAHGSRLVSPDRREALRREHIAALRAHARDGAIASRQLAAIQGEVPGNAPLLFVAAGAPAMPAGVYLVLRALGKRRD